MPRSRRYSCPRRRASFTAVVAPFAFSYSKKPFEDTDRRVERGSLARRGLAVPAAVLELLVEEPIDQPIACLAEVRTRGEDPPVDTGLDLALEEGRRRRILVPRCSCRGRGLLPSGLAHSSDPTPGPSTAAACLWWRSSPEKRRRHHPIDHRVPEGRGAGHPNPRRQPATARRQRPRRTRP